VLIVNDRNAKMTLHARSRAKALSQTDGEALTEPLERQLDSFDPRQRSQALSILRREASARLPVPSGTAVNLHAHTFYSYNVYGYSPSKYAWLARKAGLSVAGIVDLDVLDGLDEFLHAGRLLGLKTCVSLESRVFVPEFAARVVNSPGEPGIAYHMGVGFTKAVRHPFLEGMRRSAAERVREMIVRVNAFLEPVELDFDQDVVPLTPNGNVTERHACEAFERKAAQLIADPVRRAAFWTEKIGACPAPGAELQGLIRARTMKQGGVGYAQPTGGSFPAMADMNRFVLESGAIPTLAWLDGTSEGEASIEELFDVAVSSGTAALNIIPDRNYRQGVKDRRLQNLNDIVAAAERLHFPIIVGTEMNAPGNKFVDSFDTAELLPLFPQFLRGAYIVYAHSVLQRECGLGYLSEWSREAFRTTAEKNEFFETVGRVLEPAFEDRLSDLRSDPSPARILAKIR
jgi:hypothetical protein